MRTAPGADWTVESASMMTSCIQAVELAGLLEGLDQKLNRVALGFSSRIESLQNPRPRAPGPLPPSRPCSCR